MTLPILAYGHRMPGEKCASIDNACPDPDKLIDNMWETLYGANGCGLAAPQVNLPIRLFLVNSKTTFENMDEVDKKEYFEGNYQGKVPDEAYVSTSFQISSAI